MKGKVVLGLELCRRAFVVMPKAERGPVHILPAQGAVDTFFVGKRCGRSERPGRGCCCDCGKELPAVKQGWLLTPVKCITVEFHFRMLLSVVID
jgi:hypothetical protein